jgi:TetR/AcrR family fatty acid metabolism transcriptional regulator
LSTQRKSEIRKEQILRAAERVFAQKGFQEATISEVAKEASVSDATIYEYFSTKEELLFSIPGETARRGKERLEFHLKMVRGAANKLRGIIYHYLWFYQSHPDYAAVAMLILKQNRKFLETQAYNDVRELSRLILDVIEEGISSGEFKSDFNPYLVRAVILGAIEHMVIRRVLFGKPENLVGFVDQLTDLVCSGITRSEEQRRWNFSVTVTPRKEPLNEKASTRNE